MIVAGEVYVLMSVSTREMESERLANVAYVRRKERVCEIDCAMVVVEVNERMKARTLEMESVTAMFEV